MLTLIFLGCCALLCLAYFTYGKFLENRFGLNNQTLTPSHTLKDGIDFVPSKPLVLFGHHFSSIAGAGPIVGPILAGLLFGWVPALLWILIGSIFIGGVHDFGALAASLKHKARSVAEIIRTRLNRRAYLLFLIFIWLTLVYVLIVFLDLTAITINGSGPVATASGIYILCAIIFGLLLHRKTERLPILTLIFVPLIFLGIGAGQAFPLTLKAGLLGMSGQQTWSLILLVYALIASITPVWILLQPRDYLSSFLLVSSILAGFIGILIGGISGKIGISYPAFISFHSAQGDLFPMLFIIVACGAVSGFHSLVASGTTSKQLDREKDARPVGYGAMLMEAVVGLIALSTIMIISKQDPLTSSSGLKVYATGIGRFLNMIGIPQSAGTTFGALVLSTFLLTTLDTTTRLARYILQEFFHWENKKARIPATLICLILPAVFAFFPFKDTLGNPIAAWKMIWPVFGATNQLMAAMGLLVLSLWLGGKEKKPLFVIIPMIFMFGVTLYGLFLLINQFGFTIVGIISSILFLLAAYLIFETIKAKKTKN